MNCAELLCDFLTKARVRQIFGIPGYANSPVMLATHRFPELEVVLTKHEGGASWMAYGHALTSGSFGVCTGTSGPGTSNLVTGLVAAYANSLPVLVITGQVETHKFGRTAFQEMTGRGPRGVDAAQLLGHMTKMSVTVTSAAEFPALLVTAYQTMMTGRRGPVHLNIPVDLQRMETGVQEFAAADLELPPPPAPDEAAMARLIGMLDAAEAPLVVVGRGALANRRTAVSALAELRLPFATTIQAKGLSGVESPYNLGTVGTAGAPKCNDYVRQHADLVLVVGASLNEFTTNGYDQAFLLGKPTVFVNIDPSELARDPRRALAVPSDAGVFLQALTALGRVFPPVLHGDRAVSVVRDRDVEGKVAPMDLIAEIADAAPADAIFCADSGNNAVWAIHLLGLKPGQDFQIDINTGCMGSGVVSAIGAKFAAPSRPVFSICGDGGFMMNGMEVSTAADQGLALTWIVFNDHKLGMVMQGDTAKYGVSLATTFGSCDIAAMGRSFGAEAVVVHSREQLRAALAEAVQTPRLRVIDVRFNDRYLPTVYARVKPSAADLNFREFLHAQP